MVVRRSTAFSRILVLSLVFCCILYAFTTFHLSHKLASYEHHSGRSRHKSISKPSNVKARQAAPIEREQAKLKPLSISLERLPHESMFEATLKSCLPQENKKCKTFIPEKSGQRIALLAPPGRLSLALEQLVQFVIDHQDPTMELIKTPHMAPYGYGKTHGYTRIIRLVPDPLILGALDSLAAAGSTATSNDLMASLRQQIRYHCRLNHISAHTSLWTLSTKEYQQSSLEQLISDIQAFLGLPMDASIVTKLKDKPDIRAIDQIYADSSMILSEIHAKASENDLNIMKQLDEVLLEEFRISKNLTAWPCESFWTVGSNRMNPVELSPTISSIAKSISPDCNAPFTSCFVKKDKCEAKGDGICK